MKTMLAENVRRFRKERSLTQEQLSEALGAASGATAADAVQNAVNE